MTYFLKKLGIMLLTAFFVTALVFFLFQILPGSPVLSAVGIEEMDNTALIDKLNATYNLDKPPLERYLNWIKGVFNGELGNSYAFPNFTVVELLKQRLPVTLTLSFYTIIFTNIVAIGLSIIINLYRNSKLSNFLESMTMVGISMPSFWLSILLLYFAIKLFNASVTNRTLIPGDMLNNISVLMLPILALSIPNISLAVRYLSTSMKGQFNQDYVLFLKTKGLDDKEVLFKHILKNSLVPYITVMGMICISILTGSIVIENVFGLSGAGSLTMTAIKQHDYPLMQGIVLYYSFIVLSISFIVEIVYYIIDKRIVLGD